MHFYKKKLYFELQVLDRLVIISLQLKGSLRRLYFHCCLKFSVLHSDRGDHAFIFLRVCLKIPVFLVISNNKIFYSKQFWPKTNFLTSRCLVSRPQSIQFLNRVLVFGSSNEFFEKPWFLTNGFMLW
jgi:hypothetical protein